ncbi:MAG: hypothetical protein K0R75_2162 [Paenibacillaceae bacterium]|jgi:hypothetical protein|nr:hypothetical protein [Paenibacillaceae bacterium]
MEGMGKDWLPEGAGSFCLVWRSQALLGVNLARKVNYIVL